MILKPEFQVIAQNVHYNIKIMPKQLAEYCGGPSSSHVKNICFQNNTWIVNCILSVVLAGNGLAVFLTLKLFHSYAGCGDPSSDMQVRLMLLKYDASP